MNDLVLQAVSLGKAYHEKMIDVNVFEDVNLDIRAGEFISIVGPSGSGKSTLLHLLGGLDKPTYGKVFWSGDDISRFNQAKLSKKRNEALGFVYQFHHLLSEFTVLENVAMPLLIRGDSYASAKEKCENLLEKVGLKDRLAHKIPEISGGERQRAAIARALITEPLCVLADEPTGNLDQKTANQVFQVMLDLQSHSKTSFIIVTHDMHFAKEAERVLQIDNGRLC